MNLRKYLPNTIIIKLQGGLGNQLFQYALGKNLVLSRGPIVKHDLSWFGEQTKRKYELDNFNAKIDIATGEEIKKFKKYQKKTGKLSFLNFLFSIDDSIYKKEGGFNFDRKILEIKPPAYLDGFWQSEKYFANYKSAIRKDLEYRSLLSSENEKLIRFLQNQIVVAIHIRRGDYITNKAASEVLGTIDIQYYQDSIKFILDKVRDPVFMVFSDDISWVKQHLMFPTQSIFTDNECKDKDIQDFILMSKCHHHIIANSSYSWWAAWLGCKPNQIVVAPKKWFRNGYSTHDLILKDWVQL